MVSLAAFKPNSHGGEFPRVRTSEVSQINHFSAATHQRENSSRLPCSEAASRIGDHLDGTTCQVFAKNLKVQIAEGVLYPDVMVTCGKAKAGDEQMVTDPRLIVEVLSPSAKGYDKRGDAGAARRGHRRRQG